MAFSDGSVQVVPNDTNGRAVWGGYVDADTKLWLPRMDNSTAKNLRVALYDATGTKLLPDAAALADGAALPTATKTGSVAYGYDGSVLRFIRTDTSGNVLVADTAYNETSQDKWRNNTQATIFASAARTAAATSGTLTNYNARGAMFHIRVTAKAGATTLGFNIFPINLVANSALNSYATITGIAAAAGADYYWLVYPGALNADITAGNAVKGLALPRQYVFQAAPSDANSITYSVDVSYIL